MDGDPKEKPAKASTGRLAGRPVGSKSKLTKARIASALDILAALDGKDGEHGTATRLYKAAFKEGQYAVCFAILKLYREHGHGRPAEQDRPTGGAPAAIFVFNAQRGELSAELTKLLPASKTIDHDQRTNPS